jgi:ABC-type sulfate transport system substrate-binding protein
MAVNVLVHMVSLALLLSLSATAQAQKHLTLLNVSYDPTRELYQDFNAAFAKYWKEKHGEVITMKQSHGGAAKQARAVMARKPKILSRVSSKTCPCWMLGHAARP